jgi:Ca2+-binding RTX toxin-like protein
MLVEGGRWEKGDKTMRSTFRDVSPSKLSGDTSLIRSEINSFLDSSAHVDNSSVQDSFHFRDFGGFNDEIGGTFSQRLKAHLSDDGIQKQNHHVGRISSTDDAASLKVAAAPTEIETKQAVAADAPVNKAVAVGAQAALAASSNEAAAATSGYPDASNTGVSGGTMTKFTGSYHVTQDNAVISNLEVHGDIVIEAKNVTLKNVKLISDTEWHALRIMDDATGFTLQDSEIDGGGRTVNAIYGFGTFLRNNLHDVENGINVIAPTVIKDNYIHDLRGGSDAHYDGIEINGGHDIDILHNTIINDHDQTSAVMLNNDFGGLRNITIDGNRLVGGGYTVYLDDRFNGGAVDDSSIRITNNQIGDGHWGDFALYDNKPILSGNTDLDTVPTSPTPSGTVYTGTAGNDTLPLAGKVNSGNETYKGLAGNDLLKGGAGADKLDGGTGTDTASYAGSKAVNVNLQTGVATGGHAAGDKFVSIENLIGSSYNDTLTGNAANNVLNGGAGADKLTGGSGSDTASYVNATKAVGASLYNRASNTGEAAGDVYSSIENLSGSRFSDRLEGNTAVNILKGGAGNDRIYGGSNADKLYGGSGADSFIFKKIAESTMTARDMIYDFSHSQGDKIHLSAIDANTKVAGNQAFSFIGEKAFGHHAGELRYGNANGDTYIYGDVNGDGKTDFSVRLDHTIELVKGDFIL